LPKLSSRTELERWFVGKPREWAVVIAARAALRTVPFLIRGGNPPSDLVADVGRIIVLPGLRCMAPAWVAAKFPSHDADVRASAAAAADALAGADTLSSAVRAAHVVSAPASAAGYDGAAAAAHAVTAAHGAGRSDAESAAAFDSAWADVSADARELDENQTEPAALAAHTLWPHGTPAWADRAWQRLRDALLAENDDWWVWTDWYEARLNGRPPPEEALEVARVMIEQEIWRQGPRAVNGRIERLIEQYEGRTKPRPRPRREESPAESTQQHYSCFISYSSKDEEFAQRLYSDLQRRHVSCWFAPHDMTIGGKVLDGIGGAIRRHDKVLLILSEHAIKSGWVEDEVNAAFEEERKRRGTVLFPIRLDDAVLEAKEAWAEKIGRDRHIGDFRNWRNEHAYNKGLERILRDLRITEQSRPA
jgi:hypothetical protein